MGSQSLIDELTGACADVELGRRAAILMCLTNLFISGRATYDEQQIALFDDVPIRLNEQVEIVARTRLSKRHHVRELRAGGPSPIASVRFLHQLMLGGVLPGELLTEMTTCIPLGGPLPGHPWETTGYGPGLMIGRMAPAGATFGQSGAGPGSVSAVYHFSSLTKPPYNSRVCPSR